MPKLHNVKPHPAFETECICPSHRVPTSTTAYTKQPQRPAHYPQGYAENLAPLKVTVDSAPDVVGWIAATVVGYWASMLAVLFNPTWLLDSKGFGLGALLNNMRETIYLRRTLLMATILSSHGLGCAFGAHLRGLFWGTDPIKTMEMVLAKEGEWRSHRAHQQILIEAFQPGFFTRLFLIFLQGFTLFMAFATYIISPPVILAVDHHMNALATRVHSDALSAFEKKEKGEQWQMEEAMAPSAACLFWSLRPGARFRDVAWCMLADDTCHSYVNGICCDMTEGSTPGKEIELFLDTGVKMQ